MRKTGAFGLGLESLGVPSERRTLAWERVRRGIVFWVGILNKLLTPPRFLFRERNPFPGFGTRTSNDVVAPKNFSGFRSESGIFQSFGARGQRLGRHGPFLSPP